MNTATVDWTLMTAGETHVLLEHTAARLRGLDAPRDDGDGNVPTTPTWEALRPAEREVLIRAMEAELRRRGLARCFTKRTAPALHSRSRSTTLAFGRTGGIQMKRTDACQVAAELAKPENKNIVTSMNQETGEVQAFMMPRPYFVRNDAEIGRLRDRVAELKNALAKLEARGAPFVERTRLEQELKVAERELASAEFGRRQERERQRSVTGEV